MEVIKFSFTPFYFYHKANNLLKKERKYHGIFVAQMIKYFSISVRMKIKMQKWSHP